MLNLNNAPIFKWNEFPPIPDQNGFAGSFSGITHGMLMVAGGANFPDGGLPWEGSKKAWSNKIFVLESPGGHWKLVGNMPEPLGYGVSITCPAGLICIGGSNALGHTSTVWLISYQHDRLRITKLPSLPYPLANSCGTMIKKKIYIAGGLKTPSDLRPTNAFLSLDLSLDTTGQGWVTLESWPGSPRMLSVAGTLDGSFFLFSGTDLRKNEGRSERIYLKDAYRYTPGGGWHTLATIPEAVVAAPGPAFVRSKAQMLIFGGDNGVLAENAEKLGVNHPGFSDRILAYDNTTDTWAEIGKIKTVKKDDSASHPNQSVWAPVTTNLVLWKNMLVFPGGEVRPAVRTTRVLAAQKSPINLKLQSNENN
ncbi:MAG: galactose oxidase [Mucilaginibacter sp.]|uniref:galactose oxidase n=1 Tax=Mucilaginibacter sp. TaxID=1882438 RepID=UPI0032650A4B